MAVEARVNRTWAMKWAFMGVALIGWGAWCIYDGTVGYPLQDAKAAKFLEYKDDKAGWAKYAASQGWSDEDPGPARKSSDYVAQWAMLGLCWPGALFALGMVAVVSRQRLIADDQGLVGTNGKRVPYDAIVSIDKQRWDSKGIAMVHWEEDGRTGKIKIDDWVFRDGEKVLDEVEGHTGLGEAIKS